MAGARVWLQEIRNKLPSRSMGVQIGLKIYYLFNHREGVTLSEMDTALDMMRAKLFMKIWTMTVKECSSE